MVLSRMYRNAAFNLVVLNVLCEKLELESCQKKRRGFKQSKEESRTNKLKQSE